MSSHYQNQEIVKALKRRAREVGTPLYGAFELTGRCNLNCKMCYVHVLDHAAAKRMELSTSQWISIMDEAYDAGMLFALLTGGECLIRPDFKELYLHLYNKGVILSINTNAVQIDEELAKFFAKYPPEWVQVSLYGSNDDTYQAVTGARVFSKVKNAIELLRKYNVVCKVAITPSKQMLPDFENIMRYILEEGITYRINDVLIPPRSGVSHDEESALSFEERLHILRMKNRLVNGSCEETRTECPPKPHGPCNQMTKGMPCNAGTIRFVIDWAGKMHPCMCIPEIEEDTLKSSFSDAWKSIREQMAEALQPVECSGCVYEKKCSFCPAIRYDGLFSGHARQEVCDFTVEKYASGLISI